MEWNSSLYIAFIDFQKDLDSLDGETLWSLLRHYGIREKFISLIRITYNGMSCRVIHEGSLTDKFQVNTGVRQGCLLSPFLFSLAVDWIMRENTAGRKNGIQWNDSLWNQLDVLDYADNIAQLSHSHSQMQQKIRRLEEAVEKLGLYVSKDKTKSRRINNSNEAPLLLEKGNTVEISTFTYLESIVSTNGGTEDDVKARIEKTRAAFTYLGSILSTNGRTEDDVKARNGKTRAAFTYLGSIVSTNRGTEDDVKARIGKARAAFTYLGSIASTNGAVVLKMISKPEMGKPEQLLTSCTRYGEQGI